MSGSSFEQDLREARAQMCQMNEERERNAFEEDKRALDQLVHIIDADSCRRGYLKHFALFGELQAHDLPVDCVEYVIRQHRYVDERHEDYMAMKHPHYHAASSSGDGPITEQLWSVSLSASKFQ